MPDIIHQPPRRGGSLHTGTPTVTVTDNRALAVRTLQFARASADIPPDLLMTRTTFSDRGQPLTQADPRLGAAGRHNFTVATGLGGQQLQQTGADNGRAWAFPDCLGRPLWQRDGRGRLTRLTHDALGRPVTTSSQESDDAPAVVRSRLYYGDTLPAALQMSPERLRTANLCGRPVMSWDSAGMSGTAAVSLTGQPQHVTRRLLAQDDAEADWTGDDTRADTWQQWDAMLDTAQHVTRTTLDAAGRPLALTDAAGHVRTTAYDVAGQVCRQTLTLQGSETPQVLLQGQTYSAAGQPLSLTQGNGVVTTWRYEPQTQRLSGVRVERPQGHPQGAKVLQDQTYTRDPVGNVLAVNDMAQPTAWFRNQQTDGTRTFTYDSLYRLVTATGREAATLGQQGTALPALITPLPADSTAYVNYIRRYDYDSGGNLTRVRHCAAGKSWTSDILVSPTANRGLNAHLFPALSPDTPQAVDALFDEHGNQRQLQPGQALAWDRYNRLQQVTTATGKGGNGAASGREYYGYAGAERVLKVSEQRTGQGMSRQRVHYLPGLERRDTWQAGGGTPAEQLEVISADDVQVLHWTAGLPAGLDNDRARYRYGDGVNSVMLELDGDGRVISREEYYPYGGTAVWTARSQTEAGYKTLRYSGKERDATGLYYYGYRYYQPWACRWLSADPAGTVDGLNLYRMVRDNPTLYYDGDGEASRNRSRDIFRLATLGLRKKGEGMGHSLHRGLKVTRAIMVGLAIAGIAVAIAKFAGAAIVALVVVAAVSFAVGAVIGWSLSKITTAVSGLVARWLRGRSIKIQAAAGAALGAASAHVHGARLVGTATAGAVSALSGAAGGIIGNPDRGMGGAHAAGVAVGTVDTIAGGDISNAMEISAATFGAIGGFITGHQGSAEVGEHAAYGSYFGGMTGRAVDNAGSWLFNTLGGEAASGLGAAIASHYLGNNVISRFIGRWGGDGVFSFCRRHLSTGGPNEWTGSMVGAMAGGVGTALQIAAPDAHFRHRMSQLAGVVNWLGGSAMDIFGRFVLRRAARNVAIDAATSVAHSVVHGSMGVSFA
jgi:insecticidal toxin complex protein TccC